MTAFLGTSWAGFVVVTLGFMSFAAWMTGRALATTWRPAWQVAPYAILLGAADRFLIFALADGELFSVPGYAVETLIMLAVAGLAYRLTQARKMVTQYPWLYEPAGLFGWRDKVRH
jgi:hypothetical protein